ncbi:thioesterase family protein [Nocardia cyriacigeorgica]|nr:thioesterase family protein [Nocardia cyriacigeorgica]
MRGMAVCGAMARAAEQAIHALGRHDLRPARWNVDLFRAARMRPCATSTSIVQTSSRLCLVDVTLTQAGEAVARATALFLRPSETPTGSVWSGGACPQPPERDRVSSGDPERLFYSEEVGWTVSAAPHHNGRRKQTWHFPVPVVRGEYLSPFQLAATVADVMNVVANLGSSGLEFINPDVALTLARLPQGTELGLAATDRVELDGISVGTAVVFDRAGVLGAATVTGLADPRRAVDLRAFAERGAGHLYQQESP